MIRYTLPEIRRLLISLVQARPPGAGMEVTPQVLNDRYPTATGTKQYLDHLHVLSEGSKLPK
jgi:hypothetical protein